MPAVVSLANLFILDEDKLMMDAGAFMESIADADTEIADRGQVSLDQISKQVVRKEVKSTIDNMLTQTQLTQAYVAYGSIDKTVVELKKKGIEVSRSKVHRALNAKGGYKKVRERGDSGSFTNIVSSHPRDRGKKFIQHTK